MTDTITDSAGVQDAGSLDAELAEIRARSAEQPWFRRPRRVRRQVAGALVATALIAVVLFGGLSYYASEQLLRRGATDQLASVAETRAVRIEAGARRSLAQVAALASDLGVVRALDDFDAAFSALDEQLTPAQDAELDRFYQERVVDPINGADLATITVDDVKPDADAGRWVQYHHVLPDVDPATDTTDYGEAVRRHEEFITAAAATVDAGDILLISLESESIVFSSRRGIDLGTSLSDGALANSVLARLVRDELGRVRSGEGVLSDYEIYIPNSGQPSLFAAAAVRDGSRVVGAIAVQIDGASLDAITTADFQWQRIGLATGESYVVSGDRVLQSISRPWLEDPEAYLDDVDDPEQRRLIELFGSPVGIQTVDTEPVRAALLGEQFRGRTTNYLGQSTYSSSTQIDVPGVQWVVVTDVPVGDAREPVDTFLRQMLLVGAIVIPLAAIVGVLIARRLSRPIGPAVAAARAVAEGERHVSVDGLGNDEFGDLGRRLARMAAVLERQEDELTAEFERKRSMMRSVLPSEFVDDDGSIVGDGAAIDLATAVSIAIDTDEIDLEPDEMSELLVQLSRIADRLVDEHGLRRIRVAADRALYVAGIGVGDDGVERAIGFIGDVWRELDELAERTGLSATVHIGASTGAVAAGVLGGSSLTYGAWGEPVRRALAISALSRGNEALVDASMQARVADPTALVPMTGLVDLDGEPMDVYTLVRSTEPSSG